MDAGLIASPSPVGVVFSTLDLTQRCLSLGDGGNGQLSIERRQHSAAGENHLTVPEGDAINAILCAAGHNMRLLARWIRLLLPPL